MVNNDLTQITNNLYDNLETVDFFDSVDADLVARTNKAVELFEVGFALETYTDELIDAEHQTLSDLANLFKNITDTCLLSAQERNNIIDNIEDEAERHITATISGIIKKNIFEDEISNKQSDTTFSNLSTSQAYL